MIDYIHYSIPQSEFQAHHDYEIKYLERKQCYFVDCKIIKKENNYSFQICEEDLKPISDLKNETLVNKYRALLSLKEIYQHPVMCKIDIHPKLLFYDYKFQIHCLIRDIHPSLNIQLDEVKALIGFLLQDNYSFEDFDYGGLTLLNENILTKPFFGLKSYGEIEKELLKQLQIEEDKQKEFISLSKKRYRKNKRMNYLIIVIMTFILGLGLYFGGYRFYQEYHYHYGLESFVSEDYIQTMHYLDRVSLSSMNKQMLYIYAFSCVKSESLSQKQLHNILSKVSPVSNENILLYWIYIGKGSFDEAIEQGYQVKDNEYLIYAYLKKQDSIESNQKLNQETKQKQIDEIQKEINKLKQ